ncbi:spermatogenesis- and oogenesis-specific basic helix-loop-helix-containing protein 2 [Dasypus novemcinctus]|uniref:spermatogenesis- and oogenesis-specific basic helix-loop-helix-containing protein 2 n=1 Tax=Dasypus novemcinctus TaxID=9361 RepID=UPI00265FD0F0|nr:spermatogenesis- and oogenesis-specific basic helix-loop-helix-containing protein 2 [Dasypus novemcinctus]
MAASLPGEEHGRAGAQAKIDLLLVGDIIVGNLADIVQKLFSSTVKITITVSDVKQAAVFLDGCTFNMVFLKTASLPNAEELEAVKLIRFGKKKNTYLLFVFVIPENFEDCISGHGADIILTEPLTMEKMSFVVNYWKTYFSNTVKNENAVRPEEAGRPLQRSCSDHLGNFSTGLITCSESLGPDLGLELKAPLSDFKRSRKISLLHSSKEKLRRERIKDCCEQLRALLPYRKGRKSDAASVLEATVDYVQHIQERLPAAAVGQIAEVLRSNRRFCKKQPTARQPAPPGTAAAHRGSGAVTGRTSPGGTVGFPAGRCLSVCSGAAPVDPLERASRGHSAEGAAGEMCKALSPGAALSLCSFCAILPGRYSSKGASASDAAAVMSQGFSVHFPPAMPAASRFPPQHCNTLLGQACSPHPGRLQQVWAYE